MSSRNIVQSELELEQWETQNWNLPPERSSHGQTPPGWTLRYILWRFQARKEMYLINFHSQVISYLNNRASLGISATMIWCRVRDIEPLSHSWRCVDIMVEIDWTTFLHCRTDNWSLSLRFVEKIKIIILKYHLCKLLCLSWNRSSYFISYRAT